DEKSRANILSELTEPLLTLAQRLNRPRPFEGWPEARGDITHQLRFVRAPIPRLRVVNSQTGFPSLFVKRRYGNQRADAERLIFGGEIARPRIGHHVFDDSGLPGFERLAELRRDVITYAILAHYVRRVVTPTIPTFTNDR